MSQLILICPECGSKNITVWSLVPDVPHEENICSCVDCKHSHFIHYFEHEIASPSEFGGKL